MHRYHFITFLLAWLSVILSPLIEKKKKENISISVLVVYLIIGVGLAITSLCWWFKSEEWVALVHFFLDLMYIAIILIGITVIDAAKRKKRSETSLN